jgi:hypothetical protein
LCFGFRLRSPSGAWNRDGGSRFSASSRDAMKALHRSTSSAAARRRRASVVFGASGFALSEKWCGCAYGDASGGAARRATEAMASAREE